MKNEEEQQDKLNSAQEIFKNASPEYQELIKSILEEERGVMHLQRRGDIHRQIYQHILRVIK